MIRQLSIYKLMWLESVIDVLQETMEPTRF